MLCIERVFYRNFKDLTLKYFISARDYELLILI